ncbi:epoxyqueuosine reductase QueH [Fusobacterium sp.]|uniref:epoxyqueuosine reductase QueH n=1 Tax=Fusobacterium sp. TaxID=68766 RepID=UPI002611457C|nr:epoxyqueuosine reductase QueH [Fusobacterium sp.]
MKINYELEMQKIIEEIKKEGGKKPKLLLHSCCAPCSSTVIELLKECFDITIFYYNPNITENEEYHKRYDEMLEYIDKIHYNISVKEGRYNPKEDFFEKVRGLEDRKEGGERCYKCYHLRMRETAQKALEDGYDYFTTALSISPMKNSTWINEIGENLEKEFNVKYLYGDFKKKGRYQESIKISKDFNLYRQDYCGCIFSKIERENYVKSKEEKKD